MEKVDADKILSWAKEQVESKKSISREIWIEMAFKLNLLRIDEAQLYNKMRQATMKKKLDIYASQEKKNVAAATLETEASDEFCFMKDQEVKIDVIEEFVRVAKKSADLFM